MRSAASLRLGAGAFVLSLSLGGACGKIVGIHDTVNNGVGGKPVSTGSGGVIAAGGGGQGTGIRPGDAGGIGGMRSGGSGGVGGAAGLSVGPGGSGATASGGVSGAASGGVPGSGSGAGAGGRQVFGSGGVVAAGGHGAVGAGGTPSGGGPGTGGVATGGVVGSGGITPGSGGSGTGGVPAGTGGASPGCQASATQCSGAQVQSCAGGQWSAAMDCPAHQTCTGTACACADTVCRAAGPVCATSSSVGTCMQDGSCFYQPAAATACPGGTVCERVAPASCADPTWAEWPLPPVSPTAYTDNKDGTVTDNVTGLMWQSPPATTTMTQPAAVTYCATQLKAGGYGDWRLPTKIELASLVDSGRASVPTINNVFTGTVTDFYWTSTLYAQGTANAWYVNFSTGGVGFYDLTGTGNVRCVR